MSPILVCARAGDAILWDSRTVHCNAPGTAIPWNECEELRDRSLPVLQNIKPCCVGEEFEYEAQKPDELLRMIGYVCMVPRSKASEEVLERRKQAFAQDITTTHFPQYFYVSADGREFPEKDFELTAEQLALV
eukprot:c11232_g1_i1.p1 GENE.c11232_g1_i1~~c11232_g1_i1.p1  ORF type:complete len:133 (-),score=27.24 c11232_g1_i1:18-416(-)